MSSQAGGFSDKVAFIWSLAELLPGDVKFEDPTESLEALIATLNEKFGAGLGEVDVIWFDQQRAHHSQDTDNRVVALENDFTQFQVYMKSKIDDGMVERHETNAELVKRHFNDASFQDLYFSWMTRRLYEDFQNQA